MYYLTYRGHTINTLKCAKCKSYSLRLERKPSGDENWVHFGYECESCGATGSVRIASDFGFEVHETWEELDERISELKISMTVDGLKRTQ